MYLSTDLPAGNGVVVAIDGDTVTLRPDLRGNAESWFYWHVALRGAAGRRVTLDFAGQPALAPNGPAASADRGRSWRWLGPCPIDRCVLDVPPDCDELRLSMTIPYTGADLAAATAGLPRQELCRSPAGRPVPLFQIGAPPERARALMVLTARHHCCESMASFVFDGLLAGLAADARLLDRCAIVACPFMDTDGVEQGDQGKFRAPHDHNRDYSIGRYPETTALRARADALAHLPTYSIDLHCPWLRGEWNEHIYIVGNPGPDRAAAQARFASLLAEQPGERLGFAATDLLPHGQAWNTNPPERLTSCGRWFAARPPCRLAASLEIPYGLARGRAVTPESARAFGASLALALARFVETDRGE